MLKKKLILLVLMIIMSVTISGCGFKKDRPQQSPQQFDYSVYEQVSVDTLVKALEVNPAKVAQIVKNKKYKITEGSISQIDSDGDQFSIDTGLFSFDITCNVKANSTAQQQLLNLQKGQQVDVYGQISHVGEVLGYTVEVDRIELPNQTTKTTATTPSTNNVKPVNNKPVRDNSADIKNVINNFMTAFVKRDRQGMERYSFCESQMYDVNTVFDMMDKQIEVWDTILDIMKQSSGVRIPYEWQIERLNKVDNSIYEADIRFIMSPDSLLFSSIRIKNINGTWKVDSESFAIASSLSFTSAVVR